MGDHTLLYKAAFQMLQHFCMHTLSNCVSLLQWQDSSALNVTKGLFPATGRATIPCQGWKSPLHLWFSIFTRDLGVSAVGGNVHLQPRERTVSLGCIQSSVASRTPLLWSGDTPPAVLCSGNAFRLKESRFRLDSRKKFLTVGVMRPWNQMPRVVNTPPLELFKVRFDETLSNLV